MLSCQYGFKYLLYNSFIFGASHVHVWTPFVTYPIGDSFAGTFGHTSPNSSLDTAPCNLLTPFFFPAIFRAKIPILKPAFWSFSSGFIPRWVNSSFVIPSLSQIPLKYFSTKLTGNISFPAGTGVCVVNAVFDDTIDLAISKDTCFSSIVFLINSIVKNAECPSFKWYTFGLYPSVSNKRTPPIPRTISCLILISWSPPYSVVVTSLYFASFSSISESIKYRQTLPTEIFQTFTVIKLSGNFTFIKILFPLWSFTSFIGSVSKSISLYSHSCSPFPFIFWWKYPCLYNKPTPTSGIPISLAAFKWSPDKIPSPPA